MKRHLISLLISIVLLCALPMVALCDEPDSYKISVLSKAIPREVDVYFSQDEPLALAIDEKRFSDYSVTKDNHFNIKLGDNGIVVRAINSSGRVLMKRIADLDSTISFSTKEKKRTYNKYTIEVNKKVKREHEGVILIKRDTDRLMILIVMKRNQVVAEVVQRDADLYKTDEGLKVQAVIIRTILHLIAKRHQMSGYDLCDNEHCNIYKDWGNVSDRVLAAAKATEGEIITYNGAPIYPYYFKNCGGYTSLASSSFGVDDSILPYIKSVKCDYCRNSKLYKYKKRIDASVLSNIFLGKVDKDFNIKVTKYDDNDHWISLVKIISSDNAYSVTGAKFMRLISKTFGADALPSGAFRVKKKGDSFIFTGRGFGDGVGLCQTAAEKMAVLGRKYKDIIKFFYTNVKITKY